MSERINVIRRKCRTSNWRVIRPERKWSLGPVESFREDSQEAECFYASDSVGSEWAWVRAETARRFSHHHLCVGKSVHRTNTWASSNIKLRNWRLSISRRLFNVQSHSRKNKLCLWYDQRWCVCDNPEHRPLMARCALRLSAISVPSSA